MRSFGFSLDKVDRLGAVKNCVRQTDRHYVNYLCECICERNTFCFLKSLHHYRSNIYRYTFTSAKTFSGNNVCKQFIFLNAYAMQNANEILKTKMVHLLDYAINTNFSK